MAPAQPSPSFAADAARRLERPRLAALVPLEQRPDAPAAHVREGERRERVRMELLLARAAADRRR
jgi:hypothetical protein